MTDVFTPEKRSLVMKAIKSKGSQAEVAVRKALHSKGFRFILHDKRLPGKPDILLPKYKTAIQVHGCFWHGHTCIDGHTPKSKKSYWIEKLRRNKLRDRLTRRKIKALGWTVITLWECRCLNKNILPKEIARIERAINLL